MYCSADDPLVLTRIFEPQVNLVVWQQEKQPLPYVETLLSLPWKLNVKSCIALTDLESQLAEDLPDYSGRKELIERLAEIGDMFACLMDLQHLGLRIQVLDQPMCPRFHVDRVPCRLTATFAGPGTQWLSNEQVNRNYLGLKHPEEAELEGQLYSEGTQIQEMKVWEVGLMKGALWEGNENGGLVHRSPALPSGQKRLLVTLDMVS